MQQLGQNAGNHLPGHAIFILEPTALLRALVSTPDSLSQYCPLLAVCRN